MDTTVTINSVTARKLDKLCKANKCTKKDFLGAAISYFEKYGIDPLSHESPAQEMQKLIKRIDSVIGFIRTLEKEMLRPACEAIFSSEERIKFYLDSIATKQDFKLSQQDIKNLANLILDGKQAQELALKAIAKLIDAKEKTNVFTDLSKAYKS